MHYLSVSFQSELSSPRKGEIKRTIENSTKLNILVQWHTVGSRDTIAITVKFIVYGQSDQILFSMSAQYQ